LNTLLGQKSRPKRFKEVAQSRNIFNLDAFYRAIAPLAARTTSAICASFKKKNEFGRLMLRLAFLRLIRRLSMMMKLNQTRLARAYHSIKERSRAADWRSLFE
jgi:hypothetical protein